MILLPSGDLVWGFWLVFVCVLAIVSLVLTFFLLLSPCTALFFFVTVHTTNEKVKPTHNKKDREICRIGSSKGILLTCVYVDKINFHWHVPRLFKRIKLVVDLDTHTNKKKMTSRESHPDMYALFLRSSG